MLHTAAGFRNTNNERVEKVGTLSREKHNHCGKALFCVFRQTEITSLRGRPSAVPRFYFDAERKFYAAYCITCRHFHILMKKGGERSCINTI